MKTLLLVSNQYTLLDEIAAHFSKVFRVIRTNYETGELAEKMREEPDVIVINSRNMTNAQYIVINDAVESFKKSGATIILMGSVEDKDVVDRLLKLKEYENCLGMGPETILEKIMNVSKKKKIMLIDDDAMQLRNMNAILKGKYEVSMAPSGILAMTLLGKSIPDLILLDYEMPICDGPQTLAMIRGEETYKDIPVIFLTGVNDKEKIMKILEYKPQGYLLKSLSSEEILSKIEQFFA